ncbi:MAG: hypothetical protein KBT06_05200 [Prevotellaceae bacterium]|nr:hypothetical protein [Candidatus Colivivens equi]
MAETVMEQGNGTASEDMQENKTFTQEEVDNIVSSRLKREGAKYADYEELKAKASKFDEMEEANKSELQKANEKAAALQKQLDDMTKATELSNLRNKVSTDTGVPVALLTADTEDECKAQAEAILAFASTQKPSYPSVKDGGEVHNISTNKSNGQLFGEWLNEQLNS